MSQEFIWPAEGGGGSGSPYFIDPVANVAALPATAPEGTLVLVKDEDALYEYRGGMWVLFVDPGEIQADQDAQDAAIAAAQSDIDTHEARTDNPHAVTKAQVGLSNVDNTSDANKPVSTAQATAIALKIDLTEKGAVNGVATLDGSGLIPSSQIPPLAITDTFVVASQAAQTALTAEVGDVAVRTDLNKSYILRLSPASTFSNWQELLTPTDTVLSVNGQTGVVSLTTSDINEGSNLYFTDERAQDAVGTILTDTASVDLTYNDGSNTISAAVLPAGVDKNSLGGSALTIANGGTGQVTAQAALNALLPTQSGAAGKILRSDGTNTSFEYGFGLVPVTTTGTVATAVPGTMYSCTSTGGFTITLPAVPALGGVIGVMDAGETCSATNYIRVAPATGQSIDGYPVNDTLSLDYARANVVFYAAPSTTSWKVQYQATSMAPQATSSVYGTTLAPSILTPTTGSISAVNVGSYTNVATLSIPASGTYLVTGHLYTYGTTDTNGARSRFAALSEFSGATTTDQVAGTNQFEHVENQPTFDFMWIKKFTAATTVYLKLRDPSGTSSSAAGSIQSVRIGD